MLAAVENKTVVFSLFAQAKLQSAELLCAYPTSCIWGADKTIVLIATPRRVGVEVGEGKRKVMGVGVTQAVCLVFGISEADVREFREHRCMQIWGFCHVKASAAIKVQRGATARGEK